MANNLISASDRRRKNTHANVQPPAMVPNETHDQQNHSALTVKDRLAVNVSSVLKNRNENSEKKQKVNFPVIKLKN